MEKIYILGNNETLKEISENYIELPDLNKEYEIHNWIVKLFNDNEIEKLVIEIGENPELALKLGYHIRLSIENLNEKVLIPILFLSISSLNSILLKARLYSQILSTKGTYFTEFNDLESAKEEVSLIEGLAEYDYVTGFLKVIHLLPDGTIGRHSLANIWGAYAMDKAANTNALPQDSDFKKKLYFKYMAAFANLNKIKPLDILGKIQIGKANTINAAGKKILLIDDEADKGWESVLRKIFKTTSPEDFVVINEKVKDFDRFSTENKQITETQRFDLYLVDLRLNGLEEEETIKTKEFSGMKVLRKIKSINQGNQVLIFTASNKSWNFKALLDEGADGYYMKESPEYNFSQEFSNQNYKQFQNEIQTCFDNNYLFDIWVFKEAIEKHFKSNPLKFYFPNHLELLKAITYQNLILEELKASFDILKTSNSHRFNVVMLSLFKIVESLSEIFIFKDEKLFFGDKEEVKYCSYVKESKTYELKRKTSDIPNRAYESTENKMHALLLQKLGINDKPLHLFIHRITRYRNDYIHPENRFDLKPLKADDIKQWFEKLQEILIRI